MNPVLLKPEGDRRAQVVLNGKALRSEEAAAYMANRGSLLPSVIEAFDRLKSAHDLVIIEGAGSPAEVNLLMGDASKARQGLGWQPTCDFNELVRMMVEHDLAAYHPDSTVVGELVRTAT